MEISAQLISIKSAKPNFHKKVGSLLYTQLILHKNVRNSCAANLHKKVRNLFMEINCARIAYIFMQNKLRTFLWKLGCALIVY